MGIEIGQSEIIFPGGARRDLNLPLLPSLPLLLLDQNREPRPILSSLLGHGQRFYPFPFPPTPTAKTQLTILLFNSLLALSPLIELLSSPKA